MKVLADFGLQVKRKTTALLDPLLLVSGTRCFRSQRMKASMFKEELRSKWPMTTTISANLQGSGL